MTQRTIRLKYGKGEVRFEIPAQQLLCEVDGRNRPPLRDLREAYVRALEPDRLAAAQEGGQTRGPRGDHRDAQGRQHPATAGKLGSLKQNLLCLFLAS
jgi:hypothetical protein